MKLISFLVMLMLTISCSNAQTIVNRDRNGNLLGTQKVEGDRLVERDKNGNMTGYVTKEGSSWVQRDKNGNLVSRSQLIPK